MTLRDLVLAARRRLVAVGIEPDEAAMDADLLAREALGWDRARFLAHADEAAPEPFLVRYAGLVNRRASREPVSEILGRREFWGLDFEVSRDVLTPRPETEIILEEAIARVTGAFAPIGPDAAAHLPATARTALLSPWRLADVGTGSGCLAVCLAREFPRAVVFATDTSRAALDVARRNAEQHGVAARIDFRQASLLDDLPAPLDLVVSNPPYVPSGDLATLPPEVRDHEPISALDGGPDGLDLVRGLLAAAAQKLAHGGWAILEFGVGQEQGLRRAVEESGLELTAVRADLQGIPRTAVARKVRRI